MTTLNLTQEWDKVFPLSEKVNHCKVTFETQYGLTLAADLYTPKDAKGKMAAIAVSGPFGATKEQSSGLYAMQMAERGFVALAFDPSFTGESSGEPVLVSSASAVGVELPSMLPLPTHASRLLLSRRCTT